MSKSFLKKATAIVRPPERNLHQSKWSINIQCLFPSSNYFLHILKVCVMVEYQYKKQLRTSYLNWHYLPLIASCSVYQLFIVIFRTSLAIESAGYLHILFQVALSLHKRREADASFQIGLSLAIVRWGPDLEAQSKGLDYSGRLKTKISFLFAYNLQTHRWM